VRCAHCRNPIKPHHATAGRGGVGDAYHDDCWQLAQQLTAATTVEQQLDYQRRVAAEGLSALLAPYVSGFPHPQEVAPTTPDQVEVRAPGLSR
jgi:hypothetical protein